MYRFFWLTVAVLLIFSCSGSGGTTDDKDIHDDSDNVETDDTLTDDTAVDKSDSVNDADSVVTPVNAADNCSGEIDTIERSGEYSFDTSGEGFSNSFDAVCSNYINGRDAVYRLKLEKPSHVEIVVKEAPNDDSTLFIGTECGKAETGCNDDMSSTSRLSHLILDLAPGEYYLVFDSINKKDDEESKGVFRFSVKIEDDPCTPDPCRDDNRTTCVYDRGQPLCICDPGFHEDNGKCVETVCEKVSLNEIMAIQSNNAGHDYGTYFETNVGDDTKKDVFMARFLGTQKEGKYQLGVAENREVYSCKQCVMALEDTQEEGPAAKSFFAVEGTVEIEKADFSDKNYMTDVSKGELRNIKMLEIESNNTGSWKTKYRQNGSCIEIKDTSWDTYCYPSCTTEDGKEKICGTDGCGGTCGNADACSGIAEQCSVDGTA